jgi:hypothetical protein
MNATLTPGASVRQIAAIVRNAMQFCRGAWGGDALREGDDLGARPSLLPTDHDVVDLFALLKERRIDYLLVGGIAMLRYVEGRNTEAIDLLMSAPSLAMLPEIHVEETNEFFVRGHFRNLRVDVLLTVNSLFAEVQRDYAACHRFSECDVPTAAPEGLVLLKLYALPSLYRQGQFDRVSIYEGDIASLVQRHRCDLEPLLARLKPHMMESDLREIRGILREIQERIARFDQYQKYWGARFPIFLPWNIPALAPVLEACSRHSGKIELGLHTCAGGASSASSSRSRQYYA